MENNIKPELINNASQPDKSLNKKIGRNKYIIMVIVIILLIDVGLFYAWNKNKDEQVPNRQISCLNSVADISEDDFIALLKDSEEKILSQTTVNEYNSRDIFAVLLSYFVCRSGEDNRYYNKAIDYFSKLEVPSQEKEGYIHFIKNKMNLASDEDIRNIVAHGDIDTLCPEKMKDICLKNQIFINEMANTFCNELCQYIEYSINDESFFNEGVLSLNWFYNFNSTGTLSYERKILPEQAREINYWRIALAYRIGGEDAAYKICDNLSGIENSNCVEKIKHNLDFIKLKGQSKNCEYPLNILKKLFCVYSDIPIPQLKKE